MLTDHRRPLAAYGFVALACALVLWQPTLGSTMAGSPPVVKLLTETGMISSEVLHPVTGVEPDVVQVAAPQGELSVSDPEGGAAPAAEPAVQTLALGPPAGAPASNADDPGGDRDAEIDSGGGGRGPATPGEPDSQTPDPGPDHPGQGPKDKGPDHPGKGPKDKGPDHPGKGPQGKGHERPDHPRSDVQGKAAGHAGKGHQAADHPGKGPKPKGAKSKGPKGKGSKGKGHQRPDHPGKGPRGRG